MEAVHCTVVHYSSPNQCWLCSEIILSVWSCYT